jgi:GNAT superfamily N-acetyltransferase
VEQPAGHFESPRPTRRAERLRGQTRITWLAGLAALALSCYDANRLSNSEARARRESLDLHNRGMTAGESPVCVVPANEASCEDLQTVFGARGQGARCQCQRYKLRARESFGSFAVEERAFRLRQQTDCGHPESAATSGLVAYLDGKPVGWCAVEPRTAYESLLRNYRVPWEGRAEDKADDTVWAVTCLFTRAGFRKRGVSRALARAAVDFARERGARAIEGYPITTKNVIAEELHVGTESVFADAGFTEVSRPTLRRLVMRVDF